MHIDQLMAPAVLFDSDDIVLWTSGLDRLGDRFFVSLQAFVVRPSGLPYLDPRAPRSLLDPAGRPRLTIGLINDGGEQAHPMDSTGAGSDRTMSQSWWSAAEIDGSVRFDEVRLRLTVPLLDVRLDTAVPGR